MSKFYKSLHVLFINLACFSSGTHNLQRVFLRIYDAKGGSLFQAFRAETVKTGNKEPLRDRSHAYFAKKA